MKVPGGRTLVQMALVFVAITTASAFQQHYQRGTKACLPVHNCQRGQEVIPCETTYTPETCRNCRDGYYQPDIINSETPEDRKKCFKLLEGQNEFCLRYGGIPMKTNSELFKCETACQCDVTTCHWGHSCACSRRKQACPVDTFLNKDTGNCDACPKGTYKKHVGCGPCNFMPPNQTTTAVPTAISPKTLEIKAQSPSNELNISVYIVFGCIAALAVCLGVLLTIVIKYFKRTKENARIQKEMEAGHCQSLIVEPSKDCKNFPKYSSSDSGISTNDPNSDLPSSYTTNDVSNSTISKVPPQNSGRSVSTSTDPSYIDSKSDVDRSLLGTSVSQDHTQMMVGTPVTRFNPPTMVPTVHGSSLLKNPTLEGQGNLPNFSEFNNIESMQNGSMGSNPMSNLTVSPVFPSSKHCCMDKNHLKEYSEYYKKGNGKAEFNTIGRTNNYFPSTVESAPCSLESTRVKELS